MMTPITYRPIKALLLAAIFLIQPSILHANPVITEFSASNGGELLDEDGDSSDWIEIWNSGSGAIDLAGWRLTDDASSPSKWVFPAVSLSPGEYLVVFASGKDRGIAGSELHTNFALAASGEYLALISPSGLPSTEFTPSYPPQESGYSYGSSTPSSEVVLISEDAACKAIVPDATYDALVGTNWRKNDLSFDDSAWTSGAQGVGYDRDGGSYLGDIFLDVRDDMKDTNASVYIRIPITSSIDPSNILTLTLRAKFEDGFAAFVNGSAPASASSYAPSPLAWNSSTFGGNSPESLAGVFQDFDISDVIPSLDAGTNNVLAIHGLNASTTSSDYLFRAELVAQVAEPGTATTGFFATPTPGTVNGGTTYEGILTDTAFAIGRGVFSTPFTETLSCPDPGSTLIYTTDGSLPSLSNGTQIPPADEFTAPSGPVAINTTTVLRAIAVRTGYKPTNVDTQTYLFHHDVLSQDGAGLPIYSPTSTDPNYFGPAVWDYEMDPDIVNDPRFSNLAYDLLTLPILSVAIPVEDIWGTNGIYRNQTSEGSAWERECSVEIINPDGTPGYQVNGGMRMQGSGSRKRAIGKKSMRLAFRKSYGSSRFKYPLWGVTGPPEVSNIVLRGSYFDSWTFNSDGSSATGITRSNALQFRTHYATIAHARTGNLTIASNWVHLFINGQYWGPYNTHERPDGEFAELHKGGDESDYTVIKNGGELIQGSKTAWNALMALCSTYDPANHQAILDQLDPDQFIDYIFANFWGGNKDWPHNNWYVHRNDTLGGPFRFYIWDPEHYIFDSNDRTGISTSGSPGILYDRLRRDTEFQVRFGDRVHKHMFNDGVYTLQSMKDLLEDTAVELESAMNGESARWGDEQAATPYNTIDHWRPHVNYRRDTFIPARHTTFLNELRSKNLYPDVDAPVFSQHGGAITPGHQLTMSNPEGSGTLYFTDDGSDPRASGGAVSGTAQVYSTAITLNSGVTVKARLLSGTGEWSALNEATFSLGASPTTSNLVVSEFNYNPADVSPAEQAAGFSDKDDFEFIELLNTGASTLDLSHLEFDNNIEGIGFDFSTLANPLLAPGARIVLAKDSNAYALRYGSAAGVAGNFSGRLSNSGETLTLTESGSVLLSFAYDDDHPWPDSADGQGASLVLINPMSNPNHSFASNWRASGQLHGSPEGEESLPTPPVDALADADMNGRADLIDYAMRGRPQVGFGTVGSQNHLTLEFTLDPKAEGATATVEFSDNLSSWSSSGSVSLVSESYNPDGTVTYIWQADLPATSEKQFMRVNITER